MTNNNYLTEKDLAKRWRLSTATLQRWRRDNMGPSYIKMGCIRYDIKSVEEFENSKKIRLQYISNSHEASSVSLQGGVYA